MREGRRQIDFGLLLLTVFLVVFGMVMLYTISPVVARNNSGGASDRNFFFLSQLVSLSIGTVAFMFGQRVHYHIYKKWALPILLIAVVFAFLPYVPGLGVTVYGAKRWVNLGFTTVQPSELMKLGLIIYMAYWFEKIGKKVINFKAGIKPFVITLGFAGIIVALLGKDLGTYLVIFASLMMMVTVAGARFKHLGAILGSAVAVGWLAIITFPHRLNRITAFLNPNADPQGVGYHINQVLIAVGSGGLFGRGLGRSIQLYGYVPAPPTDSIFSIIAEELGLLGALIIVAAFIVLAVRGFAVARSAPDQFGQLLATGIVGMITAQAILNISAMLSLVPLTGVPLPFISFGGSSLVVSLFAMGILLNISKYTHSRKEANARSSIGRRHGRSYLSALGRSR